MAEITLTADVGRAIGTGSAKRLRAEGRIPGVVYGKGGEATPISVDWRELRSCLITEAGLNALIHLQVGGERKLTIVKELQRHPVRRHVLHVDFLLIDRESEISVEVPIVLEGEATDVLNNEGMVDQALTSLHVRTRPDNIPTHITVDISGLEINQVITVGELELPAGVVTDMEPDRPVVAGATTRLALETEEEAAEGEEGAEGEAGEGGEGETAEGGGDAGDAGAGGASADGEG